MLGICEEGGILGKNLEIGVVTELLLTGWTMKACPPEGSAVL